MDARYRGIPRTLEGNPYKNKKYQQILINSYELFPELRDQAGVAKLLKFPPLVEPNLAGCRKGKPMVPAVR